MTQTLLHLHGVILVIQVDRLLPEGAILQGAIWD